MYTVVNRLSDDKSTYCRQHCAQRIAPVFRLGGDFEFFRPVGATRLTPPRYHTNRCRGGCGAPKLKMLPKFRHKRPGAYPLCDFYQIFAVCGKHHQRTPVKIWADSLKGFRRRGV